MGDAREVKEIGRKNRYGNGRKVRGIAKVNR